MLEIDRGSVAEMRGGEMKEMCCYGGVPTQLRNINVMRILQNSSFYGYIICIVSKGES
jgi:hypothetical protein